MTYKINAPYSYLGKTAGSQDYHLFLVIYTDNRFAISDSFETAYLGDLCQINISVERMEPFTNANGRPHNFTPRFFTRYFSLTPALNSPASFNLDSSRVEINVSLVEEETCSASVLFSDADEQDLHPQAISDQIAYNCPYIFLQEDPTAIPQGSAPNADQRLRFNPYVLLAPKGYRFKPQEDLTVCDTPGNGRYESWIILEKTQDDADPFPFLDPNDFTVNAYAYDDNSDLEGSFTARVILSDAAPFAEGVEEMTPDQRKKRLFEFAQKKLRSKLLSEKDELTVRSLTIEEDETKEEESNSSRSKTRNMSSRKRHKYNAKRPAARSLNLRRDKKESKDKTDSKSKAKTTNMSSRKSNKKADCQSTSRSIVARDLPKKNNPPKSKTKNMSSRKRMPNPKTKPQTNKTQS